MLRLFSLYVRLREQLEQEIVAGKLRPGEKLDEALLAERFAVSRTPVREALQRLASSGMVVLRPRRGAFVREISLVEMVEMFEVMAELEGMCSRLAARRMTPELASQLQNSISDCKKAAESGDTDAYYRANVNFHSIIYEASQNHFLTEQANLLHARLAPYRRLQLRARHRMHQSLNEHVDIASSILEADSEKAEACMKLHVAIQGEKFSDMASALTLMK